MNHIELFQKVMADHTASVRIKSAFMSFNNAADLETIIEEVRLLSDFCLKKYFDSQLLKTDG